MLRASLRFAAIDRSDWFDELATMRTPPRHIFAFYVTRLYGRPDRNPDEMPLSAVPQDIATLDCPQWADATVQKLALRSRNLTARQPLRRHSSGSAARAASQLMDRRHQPLAFPNRNRPMVQRGARWFATPLLELLLPVTVTSAGLSYHGRSIADIRSPLSEREPRHLGAR
jgi:hypothetical protein